MFKKFAQFGADAPYPNYAGQCRTLTKVKTLFTELATVNTQALQQVLKRLEAAFVDMKRKRRSRSTSRPQSRTVWGGAHPGQ
ncbi:MAG TPA: hypothetical protein DEG17_00835 [Cyanobacteria bacterium UBA11149]|nr:hypothetical protein [Cyanobacteria bacterium UBA11366]HBK65612.1 hypothetical protein [Cyanobacteria bacterium UBA11166]HBR73431.1 hypothetical protein [Cyanobacteria bacterium UBA11159]HBS68373.1 hypothetical protein [Cyanobacteria bacterium UBA11153]HBW87458.1 hypothetical protein [Cyanobacteria bacterium UBA11149]HCA93855.1 hypothetical protein [Cyanobacteria bacterium UBA9226]